MTLMDRYGRPFPERPKHIRAIEFHGGTRPLRDDEDVVEFAIPRPDVSGNPDREEPQGV